MVVFFISHKKIILNLSLLLVVVSCACEMPTESTSPNSNYSRVLRFSYYKSDNQLTSHEILKYDALGRYVRQDVYATSGTNELNYYSIFEYDSFNRFVKEKKYRSNKQLSEVFVFIRNDVTGLTERIEFYNSNNEMTSYQDSEYLDNGLVVRSYDINGVSTSSNIYKFDSKSNTITIERCSSFIVNRHQCYISYSNVYVNNRRVRENRFSLLFDHDLSLYETYEYDSSNRLIRRSTFSSDSNLISYGTIEYEDIISDSTFINQLQSSFRFRYWYPL